MKLIDLHMHTFFSDGILSPAELIYRYKSRGCAAAAITDHADYSNMDFVIESMRKAAPRLTEFYGIKVIPGVELTYIPPEDLAYMVTNARKAGAGIVVVHGETTAENVPPGTNMAAAEARCDILAHPGRLDDATAKTAAANSVYIELTTRNGHRRTNPEVSRVALKTGCRLVLNTDSHMPDDLLNREKIDGVLEQCGLDAGFYDELYSNSVSLLERNGL